MSTLELFFSLDLSVQLQHAAIHVSHKLIAVLKKLMSEGRGTYMQSRFSRQFEVCLLCLLILVVCLLFLAYCVATDCSAMLTQLQVFFQNNSLSQRANGVLALCL